MAANANKSAPVRFGIMGCAAIAAKLARAIALASNATVAAVASRSAAKSRQFIAANSLPATTRAYDSYEALLGDDDVDAVYVPLPTSLHVRWAAAAADSGKHVLLEKPVSLCVADLDRILAACEANGVQFMDGTMWMHHPRTARMKEVLSDPNLLGPIKMLHSSCTFAAPADFLENDIRVKPNLDALGALGDLGWYCIRAILWAVNYQIPASATAIPAVRSNAAGVILACSASLHWEDGKVATFHCSFLSNTSMDINVHGTSGWLRVTDFGIPYQEESAGFEFVADARFAELHVGWSKKPEEVVVESGLPQETLMVEEFARLVGHVCRGSDRPERKWPEISRKTQLVMDAVKRSMDLGFTAVAV